MEIQMRTIVAVVLLSFACSAGDWPNWMGADLTGISKETGWSDRWPEDGLPEVWTKEIGIGFSSVSIVGGRLYTMGHDDGKETVWCLKADSGDVVWKHSYDAERNGNLYEGGPGSTPTVDGESVYTLSVDGRLLCLNRNNGTVEWERSLQVELDTRLHEWGYNSSPFIIGNRLLVQGGRVACFDKRNGRKLWLSEPHRAGYGSIRAFKHQGEMLLAGLDCEGLRVTRLNDGSEVAFHPWKSPFDTNSTTPIIVKDTIYISTGYNVGCGLFRLKDGELEELYTSRKMRNHFNNSILYQGHLYGMDGNSNLGRIVTLTCMDHQTGEVKWKQPGFGCGTVTVANDRLLILSERGDLVTGKASPDGFEEISRARILHGRCWTVPVLLDGRVYARNAEGDLVCVQLPEKK